MSGPAKVTVIDIAEADSAERLQPDCEALHARLAATSAERHTLDLTKYEIGRDKQELYREHRGRFAGSTLVDFLRVAALVAITSTVIFGSAFYFISTTPGGPDTATLFKQMFAGSSEFKVLGLPFWWVLFGISSLIIGTHYGSVFWQMRRQALALRAHEVLTQDTRRPCLMIRSFLDDEAPIYRVEQRPTRGGTSTELVAARFEEAVAPELARIGPLVAVGNPRDELPDLGAARARFADENWKTPVLQLIDQSRLIVLVAGIAPGTPEQHGAEIASGNALGLLALTPGVRWEVEHIRQSGHLGKMLVLLKPGAIGWGQAQMITTGLGTLVDFAKDAIGTKPTLAPGAVDLTHAHVMHIRDDGHVFVVTCEKRLKTAEDYCLAIQVAAHHMLVARSGGARTAHGTT